MPTYDFNMKVGDLLPAFDAVLTDKDGNPEDLSGFDGGFIFEYTLPNSTTKLTGSVTVVDAATGHVRYSWQAGDTDVVGTLEGEFRGTKGGKYQTWPSRDYAIIRIWPGK